MTPLLLKSKFPGKLDTSATAGVRSGKFPPYDQISSSVGTGLCVITLPIRETFIKCL